MLRGTRNKNVLCNKRELRLNYDYTILFVSVKRQSFRWYSYCNLCFKLVLDIDCFIRDSKHCIDLRFLFCFGSQKELERIKNP